MSIMRRVFQLKFAPFCLAAVLVVFAGQVSAGIIQGGLCQVDQVTALDGGGYGSASSCLGLLDHEAPGPGPNDSEGFLNNAQSFKDGSAIWSGSGAFGINSWVFLGKDEQSSFAFIDGTSGDPSTWELDSAVNGDFLIAVKQANELGLWYFSGLTGITEGQLFFDSIFGSGNSDDGWSHISIYAGSSAVPEPGILSLLGLGLAGLGLRRRKKALLVA